MIAPGSALLSPRGKILEGGMPRFFRRLAEGVFDEADVRHRANELADFIPKLARLMELAAPVAVGFSNGANIGGGAGAAAGSAGRCRARAMVPLGDPRARPSVARACCCFPARRTRSFLPKTAGRLAAILKDAGAAMEHKVQSVTACPRLT